MAQNTIIFTDNLSQILPLISKGIEMGLVEVGAAAQSYAKELTPVRTGTLRDSIGVEVKTADKEVYVGTMIDKFPDKPYGKYVELGARGRAGVHMLQRAASEHTDEYRKLMERNMKNA